MTSIRDCFKDTVGTLTPVLGSRAEAESAARIIFEDVAGYTRTFIFADGDREITDFMRRKIKAVVDKIVAGEPVQYAIGKARFMGNDFTVTPDVLIPRPETAALVDMITDDWQGSKDLSVLDVGTGSGCIAVSLALALPFCHVTGLDISDKAIEVARKNATDFNADVSFEKCDILKAVPPRSAYDIIVSNPPYVTDSESGDIDPRVLDYEPHLALFVPDSDPLRFYRAIATYARTALRPGGRLYFEINSRFPDEMAKLLQDEGFVRVSVTRDYKGNYRYASATTP